VAPKSTTPGVPVAAARCETPESLPTNAVALEAIAATVEDWLRDRQGSLFPFGM